MLLLASACVGGVDGFNVAAVNGGALQIQEGSLLLSAGSIGMGELQRRASYVLVDVKNPLPVPVDVELGGDLLDAAGTPVGALYPESLRIPAGGLRTYALVHHGGELLSARSAQVRVTAAQLASHSPVLTVSDGHVWNDEGIDRVIVTGYVNNHADRDARVVVVAGFYDADGKVLQRPFVTLMIPGSDKKSARFVGPIGSKRAYLFVASAAF